MRCGIVRPNSAAAPATVSGELVPQCHWEKPGKAVTGGDPRARRPAVRSVARRAGCSGVGRYGAPGWPSRLSITTADAPGSIWIARSGAPRVTLADTSNDADGRARDAASAVIYVCTTCRRPDDPEDYPRPGAALAEATIRAAENSGIAVEPLRCLANCKRGCTAVLRRTDPSAPAWTYVFGHLDPAAD